MLYTVPEKNTYENRQYRSVFGGPPGFTSTCWHVWISFPISDSSSLFRLIKLLRLESRACCNKHRKTIYIFRIWEVVCLFCNRSVDSNYTTQQYKVLKKLIKQYKKFEDISSLARLRGVLTNIPRSWRLVMKKQTSKKTERTLATYLGARVIPFVSVLPPHPAWSEPPTADPTLLEDVTGTATPLSSEPCANPAKRQIRHQKLSLWKSTAALSANEPANRWRHVSSPSQNAPPSAVLPLLPSLFYRLVVPFICTSCLLYSQDCHVIAKLSVFEPLWRRVSFRTVIPRWPWSQRHRGQRRVQKQDLLKNNEANPLMTHSSPARTEDVASKWANTEGILKIHNQRDFCLACVCMCVCVHCSWTGKA